MGGDLGAVVSEEFRRQLEKSSPSTLYIVLVTSKEIRDEAEKRKATKSVRHRKYSPAEVKDSIQRYRDLAKTLEPIQSYLDNIQVRYDARENFIATSLTAPQIFDLMQQPYVGTISPNPEFILAND